MTTIEREITAVVAEHAAHFSPRIARLHARLQATMLQPQERATGSV
jgi:hypothetical protein